MRIVLEAMMLWDQALHCQHFELARFQGMSPVFWIAPVADCSIKRSSEGSRLRLKTLLTKLTTEKRGRHLMSVSPFFFPSAEQKARLRRSACALLASMVSDKKSNFVSGPALESRDATTKGPQYPVRMRTFYLISLDWTSVICCCLILIVCESAYKKIWRSQL